MSKHNVDVTIVGCKDIPKAQLLGKQDPYVILKYGDQEFRSKTHQDGDRDPQFNETFSFVLTDEKTLVELTIMKDNRDNFLKGKDDLIGNAKADIVLALQKGELRKAFPVTSSSGQPQGQIDLVVKCPEVLKAVQAAKALEAMHVKEAKDRYTDALVAARARYYNEVHEKLAPHEAVAGVLFDEHYQEVNAVKEEEEKEMAKIFSEPQKEAAELTQQAVKEWSELTQVLLKDIPDTMEERCSDSKARFARELQTLLDIVTESDSRRTAEMKAAEQRLLSGMSDLLSKHRGAVLTACDRYSETLKGAVSRYMGEVETALRSEAEAKSLQEAAAVSGFAAPAASAPAPVAAPRSPRAAAAPRSPRPGVTPPRSPRGYTPPAPGGFAAPPVYAAAAAPGPPAGYPMTQAERQAAEAQQAQADARQARAAADRAAMEAEMARRQAANSQQMLRMQIEQQRRAAAVRRGVVGGMLLSRAIRR